MTDKIIWARPAEGATPVVVAGSVVEVENILTTLLPSFTATTVRASAVAAVIKSDDRFADISDSTSLWVSELGPDVLVHLEAHHGKRTTVGVGAYCRLENILKRLQLRYDVVEAFNTPGQVLRELCVGDFSDGDLEVLKLLAAGTSHMLFFTHNEDGKTSMPVMKFSGARYTAAKPIPTKDAKGVVGLAELWKNIYRGVFSKR